MAIDLTSIDREVEKVILKHEILFRFEQISRMKIDEDLPVSAKSVHLFKKAMLMAGELAKLNVLAKKDADNYSTVINIKPIDKKDIFTGDRIRELINKIGEHNGY